MVGILKPFACNLPWNNVGIHAHKMSSSMYLLADLTLLVLVMFFYYFLFSIVLITGQSNSQIVKFMTHSGEWVWVQIQGLIRYEKDNRTPKFLEANFKLIW